MSITDELREYALGWDEGNRVRRDLTAIADRIDAEHAQLERDYKVACEVNERQDEQYADMVHKLDRAYEKNRNQRKQLTEVQEALHRRNEGELKRRWMREKQDLELQIAKMHLESVELPEDADGVPIHVGDVVTMQLLFGGESKPLVVDRMELSHGRDGDLWCVALDTDKECWNQPSLMRHYTPPTVEDVLREFSCVLMGKREFDGDVTEAVAEYAAKLTLRGDE